jgi:HSP20 family molecular chaperone IbpA
VLTAHWTPFRDLFGFDPFAPMRSDDVLAVNTKADRRSFTRSFTVPDDVDPDKIEARAAPPHRG